MSTRAGRRCGDPCVDGMEGAALAPFLSILCNNVQIYGSDVSDTTPPTYIIRTLVSRGAIAYVKSAGEWAAFIPYGRKRRTGFPRLVRLVGENGRVSEPIEAGEGKDADVCIIPANAYFYPPEYIVRDKVDTLAAVSSALGQNIDALRQACAIVYDDPDLKGQMERANAERIKGKNTVLIQSKISAGIKMIPFSPDAKSFIPDLLAVWTNTIEELDESTGRVKVGEKTERRTDDEIAVIENSACSTIDTIIDTFNRYAGWYAIDAHAVRGSEIHKNVKDDPGETTEETENSPVEGEGEQA